MKWYVLNYNWNDKMVRPFNIFDSARFCKSLNKSLKEFVTMENFKEELRKDLQFAFWSKREYEISVGDLFEGDIHKYQKIDVYSQVLPNLDILAEYIIECHNKGISVDE